MGLMLELSKTENIIAKCECCGCELEIEPMKINSNGNRVPMTKNIKLVFRGDDFDIRREPRDD